MGWATLISISGTTVTAARQEISAALVEIAACSIDAFQFTIVDEEAGSHC
jgi:hypothetical protein